MPVGPESLVRRLSSVAAVLLLAGCPPRQAAPLESLLPEKTIEVQAAEPLALLQEGASDLDPVVRARALAGLVRASTQPAGGDWGARGLADPHPWVQRAAAEALCERLPDQATAQALLTYVGQSWSDPYVRAHVAVLLGVSEPQAAREAVSAAWQAEHDSWRRAALALAAARLGDAEAVPVLVASASKADVALEVDFVLDLGRAGIPELADAMHQGREWVEEELELTWTVGRLAAGDASAQGELRKALDAGEDEQLEVLDALAGVRGERADALLQRAASSGTELARTQARLILLARGVKDPSLLAEAAGSADPLVRAMAARWGAEAVREGALTRPRDLRALRKLLASLLVDPDPTVRLEAILCLEVMGLEGEQEALRQRLTDEEREVRLEAAALLARPPAPR